MSNFSRPIPSHLRGQSMGASQQSTFLQQKIADKKTELANLKDLQALSGGLADQMQMLADKLQTLSDGTEGTSRCIKPGTGARLCQNTKPGREKSLTRSQLSRQCFPTGITCFARSTWLQVGVVVAL
jgi:hypothetical protein